MPKIYFIISILLFVIAIVLAVFCMHYHRKETYDSQKRIDIVVARYAESLDWLCDPHIYAIITNNPAIKTTIYVYNKGHTSAPTTFLECYKNQVDLVLQQLLNVGRCDHTYLHHMITNYDNLADVTIFLPASCDMSYKIEQALFTIEHSYSDLDGTFVADRFPSPVNIQMADFQLDAWMSSNDTNKGTNNDDSMLPSPIRPFGDWYKANFRGIVTYDVVFSGIFSASRTHIQNRSQASYMQLIKYVDGHQNPEAGHYIERSWLAIFYPVAKNRIFVKGK